MKMTAKLLTCLCALLLFAGLTATVAMAADQTAPTLVSTHPANRAIDDLSGPAMVTDTQITFTLEDTTGPTVLADTTEGGGMEVKPSTPVTLAFNENLQAGPNYNAIRVTNKFGQDIKITKTIKERVLTIAPASGAWDDERGYGYTVTIPANAVEDLRGNGMVAEYRTGFTTVDSKPPKLLAVIPANGATNVRLDAPLVLIFDDQIRTADNPQHYSLASSNPEKDAFQYFGWSSYANTLTIFPYDSNVWNNGYSTTYTLTILEHEIVDDSFLEYPSKIIVRFTTIGLLSAKPSAAKASPSGYNSIQLNWNGLPGTTNYEIWRSTSRDGTYTRAGITASTSFTNTGLATDKTYFFKVRACQAVDGVNYYSAWSDIVSAKPIPVPPSNVNAVAATPSSAKITWDKVTGATNYEVWRATSQTGTYARIGMTAATSFTNTGLTTNTTYYYKVRTYQAIGGKSYYSAWSAIVSAKPVPAPPGNVKATAVSSSSAKITWNMVAGAKNYEVWRAASPTGTYTRVGMPAATSFTNTGLTVNTTYYYKVRAYLSVGGKYCFSAWSAIVSAKPIPAPPSNVKAAPVTSSSAKITWNMVAGAKNYEVWRAASPTGTYTRVGMPASTSFTNTGLTVNTTYYYKVRAYLSVGGKYCFSAWSAIVSAKPIPAPPGSVKAIPVSPSSVKITWSAVAGAKNYEVWRAASPTDTYTRVGMTAATSFTNTGLTTNTTYYYKVRAYLSVGGKNCFSAWSTVVSAKP